MDLLNSTSECRLCRIINNNFENNNIHNNILYESAHFVWLPGLGAFIEGYSLVVSKSHILNSGSLPDFLLEELEIILSFAKARIQHIYGIIPIICEHGSMGKNNYAGSCIDHHHLHIFPVQMFQIPDIIKANLTNHKIIKSLKELRAYQKKQLSYIFIMDSNEHKHVFDAKILSRQYLRQVVAVESGYINDWDWRARPFHNNIISFVNKMQPIIETY
jgi:diadenosine tetraphosphate (Ap4A) HIT family hydrolase